jgi:hypothetical protein
MAAFESAFASSSAKFFKNLGISDVTFVNPSTQARTTYNATSPRLAHDTVASVGGQLVPLTAAGIEDPDVINKVSQNSFTISGRVDLAKSPGFLPGGTVRVFVGRSGAPVPVTLNPDGSFTAGVITVDDNQYWYIDRHYVAVNFYNGIDINTVVYQVAVTPPS